MTRRNRVNPAGEILANPAKRTLLGNRGCLHDDDGNVVRTSARPAWVACVLSFQGVRRALMTPGHYTELFFLDEVTALAAGHRPCFECRRADAKLFSERWFEANPSAKAEGNGIGVLDGHLRSEQNKEEDTSPAINTLPNGTVIQDVRTQQFYALRENVALPWSFSGYGDGVTLDSLPGDVKVVTSPSVLRTLRTGYRPAFHPSAG